MHSDTRFHAFWRRAAATTRRLPQSALAVAVIATTVSQPTTVLADINPATSGLAQTCQIAATTSNGTIAGLPQVAVTEPIRFEQQLSFGEGTIYQDVFERSDGSTYAASEIRLNTDTADGVTLDMASVALEVNSVALDLVAGTTPVADTFVLDLTEPDSIRVLFPGDTAEILSNPTGEGVPSWTVDSGGAIFVLSVGGQVAAPQGSIVDAGSCYASISTGPSNRNARLDHAEAAVSGLDLEVSKQTGRASASSGSAIEYRIETNIPATDDAGIATGPVFDATVIDSLPSGLVVDESTISDGGVYDATERTITWEFDRLDPETATTVSYTATVSGEPGSVVTNAVTADGSGQPGESAGELSVTDDGYADVTISGAAPRITKDVDSTVVASGVESTYTVHVVVPAGSTFFDVAMVDTLPDGMINPAPISLVCNGCPAADPATSQLGPSTGVPIQFGWFLGDLPPAAADREYTATYTTEGADTYADGGALSAGDTLDNLAELVWNDQDQFPAPAGLLDRSSWTGSAVDTAQVTVANPAVTIAKVAPDGPGPYQIGAVEYQLVVTNSGDVPVTDVVIRDTPDPANKPDYLDYYGASHNLRVTHWPYSSEMYFEFLFEDQLEPGESITIDLEAYFEPPTSTTEIISNTGSVLSFVDPFGAEHTDVDPAQVDVTFGLPLLVPTKSLLTPASGVIAPGGIATWEVTVRNDGEVPSDVRLCDDLPGGYDYVIGSASSEFWPTTSTDCDMAFVSYDELAPGESVTLTYQTITADDAADGTVVNHVAAQGIIGGGNFTSYNGIVVATDDEASITTTLPDASIEKLPNADQLIPILQSGTSSYQIVVTNASAQVGLPEFTIVDTLPAHLIYPGGFTVSASPAAPAPVVTADVTNADVGEQIEFTASGLEPGQSLTISLPVTHDGTSPSADPEQVNTAELRVPGLDPVTDDATLFAQTSITPPRVVKTVDPAALPVGETATFTADLTVPDNGESVFDLIVRDDFADGFTPTGTVTVECLTGPCPTLPSAVTVSPFVAQPDGGWRFEAAIGDVPANTGEFTYRLTYDAILDETFEGTGTPAAGSDVQTGQSGTPVENVMVPHFNLTDSHAGAPPAGETYAARGFRGAAEVEPVTPFLTIEKAASADDVEVGERVTYSITVENTGSSSAYDVVVSDDAAQGQLRDVVLTANTSAAVTDDWTVADPTVSWLIPEIAPGATVVLEYSGTSLPAAELVSSGANSDPDLHRNTAALEAYFGAAAAVPDRVEYDNLTEDSHDLLVHSPRPDIVQLVTSNSCPVVDLGEQWSFTINAGNLGNSAGFPTTVANLYDVTITEELAPGFRYIAGSTTMTGSAALADGLTEPAVTTAADGSQTLTWTFAQFDAGTSPAVSISIATTATASGVSAGQVANATIWGSDFSGATVRGEDEGRSYEYNDVYPAGCITPPEIEKEPLTRGGIINNPNPGIAGFGEEWVWDTTILVRDETLTGVRLLDTLPLGVSYTGGTTITPAVPFTETVVPLADGRTSIEIIFSDPFEANTTYILDMPTTIDADADVSAPLVNTIELDTDQELFGEGCAVDRLCSEGSIQVRSLDTPTITKRTTSTVVQSVGGSWNYVIEVLIPAGYGGMEVTVADALQFSLDSVPSGESGTGIPGAYPSGSYTGSCISGCSSSGSITASRLPKRWYPQTRSLSTTYENTQTPYAWILESSRGSGVLLPHNEDRTLRFTVGMRQYNYYSTPSFSFPIGTGPGVDHYSITNRATISESTDPDYNISRSSALNVGTALRNETLTILDEAFVTVEATQPMPAITKSCVDAVNGTASDDDTASSPGVTPTPAGSPNVRCTVTVSLDENVSPIYDVEIEDLLSSSTTTFAEFIGFDNVPSNVLRTQTPNPGNEVPGMWRIDQMDPGESFSIDLLYRVGIDEAADGTNLSVELRNTARVTSLSLTNGGPTVDITTVAATARIRAMRPEANVAKRLAPTEQSMTSDSPPEAIVDQPVTFEVRADLFGNGDQASMGLTDTLPAGWSYVAGSATLKVPNPRLAPFAPTYESLFEPTVLEQAAVCNIDEHHNNGDTLTWNFQRSTIGQNQPWDVTKTFDLAADMSPDESNPTASQNWDELWMIDPTEWDAFVDGSAMAYGEGEAANGWTTYEWSAIEDYLWSYERPPSSLYIQYQAFPTIEALDCTTAGPEAELFANTVSLTVPRIDLGTTDTSVAVLDVPLSGTLTVTKSPKDGLTVDGTTAIFEIDVSNDSGADLTNVSVIDVLQDVNRRSLAYVPASFTQSPSTITVHEVGVSDIPGGQRIEWIIPSLKDGEVLRLIVSVPIPDGTPDQSLLDNTVTVTADGITEAAIDTAGYTVTNPAPAPDITKTMPATATPPDSFTVTATMVLPGDDAFLDLAVTDVVPDGLRFVSYGEATCEADGFSCSPFAATPLAAQDNAATGETTIGWWLGDLAGASVERTVTFTYDVAVEAELADGSQLLPGTKLVNVITAVSNESDQIADSAPPVTPVDPADFAYTSSAPGEAEVEIVLPQLVLDKTPNTYGPLSAGQSVTYTLTVHNVGTGTAYRVPVVDTPNAAVASVTYGDAAASLVDGWTEEDPDMRWLLASIAPGDTATISYDVVTRSDIESLGLASIDNAADVEPYRARPARITGDRLYDGVDPVNVTIPFVGSGLSIQKFAGDGCTGETEAFVPGTSVDFCIQVTNNGTGPAFDVTVSDTPANGFTYIANSGQLDGAPAEPTIQTAGAITTLHWPVGDLAVNETVQIEYALDTDRSLHSSLQNQATANSLRANGTAFPAGTPGTTATDTAAAVPAVASQEISKTPDVQRVLYSPTDGNLVEWTITVSNPREIALTELVVTDVLPVPFEFVELTSATAVQTTTSTHSNGLGDTIEWRWDGPLEAGEEATFVLSGHLPAGLPLDGGNVDDVRYQNEVSLRSAQIPETVENTAMVAVEVPVPSPEIDKVVTPEDVGFGDLVTSTLTVDVPTQGWTQTLFDTVVTDTLPPGWVYDGNAVLTCLQGCDAVPELLSFDVAQNNDGTTSVAWMIDRLMIPDDGPVQFAITYDSYISLEASPGEVLINTAHVRANRTDVVPDGTDPRCEGCTFTEEPPPSEDDTTPHRPRLVLDKDVSCDRTANDPDDADSCIVEVGDKVTYTITVTNTGDWPAYDATITDTPDRRLGSISIAPHDDLVLVDQISDDGNGLAWTLAGPLEAGDSITISYTATVKAASNGTAISNTADVPSYRGTPSIERDGDPERWPEFDDVDDDTVRLTTPTSDVNRIPSTLAFTGTSSGKLLPFGFGTILLGFVLLWQRRRHVDTAL